MYKEYWSSSEVCLLFDIKNRQVLLNSEKRGDIPTAERELRGKIQVRRWHISQLPKIGEVLGFLSKPKKQVVYCIYTPKGGVLKSTTTVNFARGLALHGIKTLLIGLDTIQSSATRYALRPNKIETLEDLEKLENEKGLYHLLIQGADINEVIKSTSLPTLDVLPETPELNKLEMEITLKQKRESFFKDKLMGLIGNYDVIIFDNGAAWNRLVENSLMVANNVISPIGCEIEAAKSLESNFKMVYDFKDMMGIKWNSFTHIPTLLERNKISELIRAKYLNMFESTITVNTYIRRTVKAQEARMAHLSSIEYDPSSDIAKDYKSALIEVWQKTLSSDR